MIPLIVGTALALIALSFVLYPLLVGDAGPEAEVSAHSVRSESSQFSAVDALREIEFDKATGKLSDTDYADLKASYTQRAITAMRSSGPVCESCGPRPEGDAVFCSNCGLRIQGPQT